MTQRQVSHARGELPTCSCGRTPRHFHDARAPHAGGGEIVECSPCDQRSGKHPTLDAAVRDFCRRVGVVIPDNAVAQPRLLRTRSA
jgi:hypothetical protein